MKYYQDLTLIENNDIAWFTLWSKVYQQVHLALVETLDNEKSSIGVAFPEYRDNIILGSKLRVFAESENELTQLDMQKWLARLTDYVHITSIRPTPKDVNAYAIFSRYQPRYLNKERMARRRVKRHNETHDQALQHYEGLRPKKVRGPFIRLKSLSNGHEHCIFIKKASAEVPVNEGFSSYGLSKISTVPDF